MLFEQSSTVTPLIIATIGRVRPLGIDVPGSGACLKTAAPFGRQARERPTSLVLPEGWVRLRRDGPDRDVYDRHLAYVLTGKTGSA